MRTGILIALLVPAVALAGAPRKRGKAGKKAAPVVDKAPPQDPEPPPAADKTLPLPTTGTGPGAMPTTLNGSTPPAAGTTPSGTPAGSQPTGQPTSNPTGGSSGGTGGTTGTGTGTTGTGTGTGTGDAAPADGTDIDTLRQEYLSLRDELFKSRARANAVASQLYSTRMTIRFTWGSARHYGVSKASIRLDGATVFEDASGAIASDDGVRFDGYVAPGRHLVTFHVEATGKDDDTFTSATETQIVVKAVGDKDIVVAAKGHDNGDIAYAWKRSEKGSYGLGIDVNVKSVASGAAKGKK